MLAIGSPQLTEVSTPQRLLLGPGPANVSPRVQTAALAPLLGHLDPVYLGLMNDVQAGLRYVFQTANRTTLAVAGTGSAGMEAAVCSLIEPGDVAVIGSAATSATAWSRWRNAAAQLWSELRASGAAPWTPRRSAGPVRNTSPKCSSPSTQRRPPASCNRWRHWLLPPTTTARCCCWIR